MKKLHGCISVALVLSLLSVPVLAGLTTVTVTGGTNNYTWDPELHEVRIDNDIPGAIRMISYFGWEDISKFPEFNDGNGKFYTHEHYDYADSGFSSLDNVYSNLPYASYDVENDWNSKTAGHEELEVTCAAHLNSTPVLEDATYFFDTTWTGPIGGRAFKGSVRSQLSTLISAPEYNEYQTEYKGDINGTYAYGSSGTRSFSINMEQYEADEIRLRSSLTQQSDAGDDEKVRIVHSIAEEGNMVHLQDAQAATLRVASTAEQLSLMEDAKVMLTFTQPISHTDLEQILRDSNAALDHCVLRYEDSEGKRITGWTSDVSETHLQEKLAHLTKIHDNVTYSGIVSAEITVDLTEENYAAFSDSEWVYFADLSDTIVRLENQDFQRELKVQIWDLSWDLEFMD